MEVIKIKVELSFRHESISGKKINVVIDGPPNEVNGIVNAIRDSELIKSFDWKEI